MRRNRNRKHFRSARNSLLGSVLTYGPSGPAVRTSNGSGEELTLSRGPNGAWRAVWLSNDGKEEILAITPKRLRWRLEQMGIKLWPSKYALEALED